MNSGPSSAPASVPACSVAARCASVLDGSASLRRSSIGLLRSSIELSSCRGLAAMRPPDARALARPPMHDASQLLGELKAVSVGVEHVQEPHLAVQLEDDADRHTLVP